MTEGGGSGFRGALRRTFGDGDNPMNWAFPIGRVWGIDVKVHVVLIVFIVLQLLASFSGGSAGFEIVLFMMIALFGLVFLHELGHCIACRRVGGDATEIVLWPLGGLAMCAPPPTWKAHLVTVLGGPAVNVLLVPVLALLVLAVGLDAGMLVFEPLAPGKKLNSIASGSTSTTLTYVRMAVWWTYVINWILLAFNMLTPMYPMDAARTVHALLWRKIGYRRAMEITVRVGIVAAIVLGLLGATFNNTLLVIIAVFGGLTCFVERQRLRFGDEMGIYAAPEHESWRGAPGPDEDRHRKRQEKAEERERRHAEDVDRVLDKIAQHGIQSLTRSEKRLLQKETDRKRGSP